MKNESRKLRDSFWLWGHAAGSHDDGHGLPRPSRITPVEAAAYMGIPNVVMVRYSGRPALPFDQFAIPFRSLKQVVWSVVGATGQSDERERSHVLQLAAHHPNITGVIMDDFFSEEGVAVLSPDELQDLQDQLALKDRRLNLWVVLYDYQLNKPFTDYAKFLDVATLWTWDSSRLKDLDARLTGLEKLAPQCAKVLGCYMWDYGRKKPMPPDLMEHQCNLGLRWLKQGRIAGMIFLASCICDLELEAVERTRNWIASVGDEPAANDAPVVNAP